MKKAFKAGIVFTVIYGICFVGAIGTCSIFEQVHGRMPSTLLAVVFGMFWGILALATHFIIYYIEYEIKQRKDENEGK